MFNDPEKNANNQPPVKKGDTDPKPLEQSPVTLATGLPEQVRSESDQQKIKSATTEAVFPSQFSDAMMPRKTQPALQPDTIAIHLPGREQPLTFHDKEEIILGRSDASSVSLPDIDLNADQGIMLGVSRHHATIRRTEAGYYIRDLNSTNGTLLNGTRLVSGQPHRLQSGDQIRLGQLGLYVYFSFSSKKSIDTVLLEDKSLAHTDKLREGLTIDFLQEKITPYLNALASIQQILDEVQKQMFKVTIRSMTPHRNGKWIEVSIQGVGQTIQAVRSTIAPLRALQAPEPESEAPQPTLSVSKPPATLVPESVAKETETPEVASAESAIKLLENLATSAYGHEVNVARAILTSVDPTLSETNLSAFVKQIVPHINSIVSSDLEMIPPRHG
jgi:pSer/pThr/pTyr-binding forkhead associated (FHA) protein